MHSFPSSLLRRINLNPPFVSWESRHLNDVTIITGQEIQNECKVQIVAPRVDTMLLLLTVGPQVYNLILEYSNIYAELFSFALVFERQILPFVSVTAIAPQWVTHWICKHSMRRPRYSFLSPLGFQGFYRHSIGLHNFYPSMGMYNSGPNNVDFDGDEMNLHIPYLFTGDTDSYLVTTVRNIIQSQKQYAQREKLEEDSKRDDVSARGISLSKLKRENVVNHIPVQDNNAARRHTRHENKKRAIVQKQPKSANKSRRCATSKR